MLAACSLRKYIIFILDLLQGAESIPGDMSENPTRWINEAFQVGLVETIRWWSASYSRHIYQICWGLQTISLYDQTNHICFKKEWTTWFAPCMPLANRDFTIFVGGAGVHSSDSNFRNSLGCVSRQEHNDCSPTGWCCCGLCFGTAQSSCQNSIWQLSAKHAAHTHTHTQTHTHTHLGLRLSTPEFI